MTDDTSPMSELIVAPAARRPTVLAVDDAPDNLWLLSGLLKPLYRVKLANGGAKALDMVQAGERPDIVLLDIMMPDVSGYDVCRALKQSPATRDIPVIFLTAMTSAEE